MTNSANAFIEFDNVRKAFGERVVLDGVTLSICTGETVALLGPSGGGKSTLLRTVNALCDFDSGAIRVGPHQLGHSAAMAVKRTPCGRFAGSWAWCFKIFNSSRI